MRALNPQDRALSAMQYGGVFAKVRRIVSTLANWIRRRFTSYGLLSRVLSPEVTLTTSEMSSYFVGHPHDQGDPAEV